MFGNPCKLIQNRLKAYIDQELDPGRAQRMKHHLRACAGCRRLLEELRETAAELDSLEGIEPGPYFVDLTVSRMQSIEKPCGDSEGENVAARFWFLTPLGRATAMVFLLGLLTGQFVSGWIVRHGPPSIPSHEQDLSARYVESLGEMQSLALAEGYWDITAPEKEENP